MKNTATNTKLIKAMKEQSFKDKAVSEIKQAIQDIKKGVFLF